MQLGGRTRERRDDMANNNAIEMEDVTFHQCVSLNSYEKDGSITFIPPDGQFELLSYRLSRSITVSVLPPHPHPNTLGEDNQLFHPRN